MYGKKTGTFLAALLAVVTIFSACAAEDGNPRDYWDDAAGIYYDVDGNPHAIENTDTGTTTGGSRTTDSAQPTGSTPAGDYPAKNADGSMTVESGQIQIEEPEEQSGGLTPDEWSARMVKAMNANGVTTGTVYTDPDGNTVSASILHLGLGRSRILADGKEMLVPTSSLSWDAEAPEGKELAVIGAAKQGYAFLRASKSGKAFIMDHILTGQVVRVISSGKNWTMVDHDGMRGYVRTSSLTFYSNEVREYATGMISYKGRTKGNATINVRANAKNGSRILADYVIGTEITVFGEEDKWYEVDVEGWHCYILKEYVTLDS